MLKNNVSRNVFSDEICTYETFVSQKKKNIALCEDRTHDLPIMRLTRCLLR